MSSLYKDNSLHEIEPLYIRLYKSIKNEIEEGRLKADERLPSIRIMAKSLSMSRTTIENAYNQLNLEGYIYSKEKRGYFISKLDHDFHRIDNKFITINSENMSSSFNDKFLDDTIFDNITWRKCYNEILLYQNKKLLVEGELQGELALREQIARYVYNSRGVKCSPSQIVIAAGVQVLIAILSNVLKQCGLERIAFEEPGFVDVRHIFKDHSFEIYPINVNEDGLDMEQLKVNEANICYTSPSHQFPTGMVMPIANRMRLLKWADENNAYIIEDDYDSELRYTGKPVPSLHGLDINNRVIYFGSFSTVFLATMRMSYMILPDKLLKIYTENKHKYNQTTPTLDQLTMALYMKEGHFERHLRRSRTKFALKLEKTICALDQLAKDKLTVYKSNSGVYLLIRVNELEHNNTDNTRLNQWQEKEVLNHSICHRNDYIEYIIKKGREFGIRINRVSEDMILLKFSSILDEKINEAIKTIFAKC